MGDITGEPSSGFRPLPGWRAGIFGDTLESIGAVVPLRPLPDRAANPTFGG